MCAQWDKSKCDQIKLPKILERLKSTVRHNSDGSISFGIGDSIFDDCLSMIRNCILLSDEIEDRGPHGFIFSALSITCQTGDLTADRLMSEVRNAERKYLRKPIVKYSLLTHISLGSSIPVKCVRVQGHVATIYPHMPRRFRLSQHEAEDEERWYRNRARPSRWKYIVISTKGRTPFAAGRKAIDQLELLISLWNLTLNSGVRSSRSSGYGYNRPVNKIICGPTYFIFSQGGGESKDVWWHDPEYIEPISPFNDSGKWKIVEENRKWFMKQIHKSSYTIDICNALSRYNSALNPSSRDNQFLKLWSTLELLTHTARNKYDVTIRRASFIWKDPNYHYQILNNLRYLRNAAVHESSDITDGELSVYQLKRYVEQLLFFHIRNCTRHKSMSESVEMLDLPAEMPAIRKKLSLLKRAVRFRS